LTSSQLSPTGLITILSSTLLAGGAMRERHNL
jgi:hypothetical protein